MKLSIFLFGGATLFGLAMIAYILVLELPKLTAHHYEGVVVALDSSHPNPINYAYPIVRFTDAQGNQIEFSNYDASDTSFTAASKMHQYSVGDRIEVEWSGGRYRAITRNEYAVVVFLVSLLSVFTFIMGINLWRAVR